MSYADAKGLLPEELLTVRATGLNCLFLINFSGSAGRKGDSRSVSKRGNQDPIGKIPKSYKKNKKK